MVQIKEERGRAKDGKIVPEEGTTCARVLLQALNTYEGLEARRGRRGGRREWRSQVTQGLRDHGKEQVAFNSIK